MEVTQQETAKVFRTMRGALLARGVKCGLADSYAMQSVQIYKRAIWRGCPAPFAFAVVTGERRVEHYAALSGSAAA